MYKWGQKIIAEKREQMKLDNIKHHHLDPIVIENTEFYPGDIDTIRIPVGRMPSDTKLFVNANIYRAQKPGPTVLVMGGVHGDEINGIEINDQLIRSGNFENVIRGTIICIPLLNVFGFNNFSRDVPDGKDVNRSFPGNSNGSLASRVARTLTKQILPYVDIAMDMHTGGASRYNYPQTRFSRRDKRAYELAKVFNAPYNIRSNMIPKSFRKSAFDMGISSIVFEGGESVRFDGLSIGKGKRGVLRVLHALGMIKYKTNLKQSLQINKTNWQRASMSGIFIWEKSSGERVEKGDRLGEIKDPYGSKNVVILSKYTGQIIGHNNASVVNSGDALFHIGHDEDIIGF